MNSTLTYEQPLNERVRTFLRIEHLFDFADFCLQRDSEWDARVCLNSLLEVINLLSRTDIKTELVKELERHATTLSSLKQNPGVDQSRLRSVLAEVTRNLDTLRSVGCHPGQKLKSSELVNSIKQRTSIPGGTCSFDLPGFHYWLNRPESEKRDQIDAWMEDLMVVRNGIKLALQMIRNSSTPSNETADAGFFQRPIESGTSCQMIRVVMPVAARCYPEISGGKHRYTIRFLHYSSSGDRPTPWPEPVSFVLHCCIL